MADNEIDAALNMAHRMDKAGLPQKQQERQLRKRIWDDSSKTVMSMKRYGRGHEMSHHGVAASSLNVDHPYGDGKHTESGRQTLSRLGAGRAYADKDEPKYGGY